MERIDYRQASPETLRAMSGLERVVEQGGLEPFLIELVKTRASQLNGCAYCVDMHTKDAEAMGERSQRLNLVAVWREAPVFSERERAALAWTEAITLVSTSRVPQDVYERVRREFSDKELVDLTIAIIAINGWNRLAVGFRTVPGSYQPSRPS